MKAIINYDAIPHKGFNFVVEIQNYLGQLIKTISIKNENEVENVDENEFKLLLEKIPNNGYANIDTDAFLKEDATPCYIPENGESLNDVYCYLSLKALVDAWSLDNAGYLNEYETNSNAILENMFTDLSWEFPETYLEGLTY